MSEIQKAHIEHDQKILRIISITTVLTFPYNFKVSLNDLVMENEMKMLNI